MLIPNKFNGYSRDGIRKYNVDGGVGEMALLDAVLAGAGTGAAIGGGSALLTGQDPMQGILRGGLMGGATGGLFNGLSGAMPGATSAGATSSGAASTIPAATDAAAANIMSQQPMLGATQQALGNQNLLQSGLDLGGMNPATTTSANAVSPTGVPSWWNSLTDKQKMLTGGAGVAGLAMLSDQNKYGIPAQKPYTGALSRFTYSPDTYKPSIMESNPYRPSLYAEGGITSLGHGGDMMVGNNLPQSPDQFNQDGTGHQDLPYSTSPTQFMASGGISSLGSYSDGGRLLKGPGDGMSDSIPANIAGKRPARLATDEFVVPADVVSHLGNGSSDAGAKQLYSMMEKVRKARTGRPAQGRQITPGKYLPA